MRSAAISIPKSRTPINILGTTLCISSCPNTNNILYGSPSDNYIPPQRSFKPLSCPDAPTTTSMEEYMSCYISSESEDEEDNIFDGNFDSDHPVISKIFAEVAKDLLKKSEN